MKRCPQFPNKKRYPTKNDAETAIIIQRSEGSVELDCYYCDACKGWHLTSRN
jgi:hypothetical protein